MDWDLNLEILSTIESSKKSKDLWPSVFQIIEAKLKIEVVHFFSKVENEFTFFYPTKTKSSDIDLDNLFLSEDENFHDAQSGNFQLIFEIKGAFYYLQGKAEKRIVEEKLQFLSFHLRNSLTHFEQLIEHEHLQKLSKQIHTIKKIGQEISSEKDKQALLVKILKETIKLVSSEKGFIMLHNKSTHLLELEVVHGLPNPEAEDLINKGILKTSGIRPGEGIQGRVFRKNKSIKVNKHLTPVEQEESLFENFQNIICVPLCINNEPFGVIYVTNKKHNLPFENEDLNLVTILAASISSIIYQVQLYKASITDPLTELYRRPYFEEKLKSELKRSLRFKRNTSIVAIDIDHFKRVNDTYGHLAGDVVLQNVSASIMRVIRKNIDVPARFGGEEFFIFLPETNSAGARKLSERLRKTIEQEVHHYDGEEIRITVSLGIASAPRHAEDYNSLLAKADEALYFSKSNGRNQTTVFSEIKEHVNS